MTRLRALLLKELLDVVRNRAALLPVMIATLAFLVVPLALAVVVPSVTGHPLGEDGDLAKASLVLGPHADLSTNGRVQLFIFEQFLMVFLLMPVTGAMALAAHTIVSEKQARTLEPLLATPITTLELLVAKVVGASVPTLAISMVGLGLYALVIVAVAEPGVTQAMMGPRTIMLIFGVGPTCTLLALQLAIVISSRANDPRTAQQFGVLIIAPITVLLIAQFNGSVWLSTTTLGAIALGLGAAWALLTLASVAIFQRETILTRWR